MKAIIVDAPGSADALRAGEAPRPEPGPDDVVIAVHATAVNRADVYQREGRYPPPPGASPILGLECAGVVASVGARVRRFRPGDRVMALLTGGGYAEFATADQGSVLRLPDGWSMVEGGAFPEVFLTAYLNLFRLGGWRAGEAALVHGGASGVGTAALALAREAGLPLYATAGGPEKCARVRELGAAGAFDYRGDWAGELREATGGRGVDVILDPIGGRYLEAHLGLLAPGGRLVVIGGMGGQRRAELDFATLLSKRITIVGSTLRARPAAEKAALVLEFEDRFGAAMAAGRLRPLIDSTFPLEEAAAAHRRLESGDHVGKVALLVRDS
jgi:putative PIG3 family NAD(P)H quinone oxidoreductase